MPKPTQTRKEPIDAEREKNLVFGQFIRETREALGIGRKEMCDALGFGGSYLQALENGMIGTPDKDKLHAMAEFLMVPVEDFLRKLGWLPETQTRMLLDPTLIAVARKMPVDRQRLWAEMMRKMELESAREAAEAAA